MENVQYQHMLFSRAKVVPAYLKKEQWLRLCHVFALLNASAKFCVACVLARGLEVTVLLSHLGNVSFAITQVKRTLSHVFLLLEICCTVEYVP